MNRKFVLVALGLSLSLPTAALAKRAPAEAALNADDPSTLQVTQDVKVVFHVSEDVWKKGQPQALWYLDKLVNMAYPKAGVEQAEQDFKLVAHNAPVYWFFTDEAWAGAKGKNPAAPTDHNPNVALIQSLLDAGVDIEVCGATLKAKGYTADMLLPGIQLTPAGLPRVVDLQLQGYAYLNLQ